MYLVGIFYGDQMVEISPIFDVKDFKTPYQHKLPFNSKDDQRKSITCRNIL
jgi:hypothetical protein